ncbi:MAG TPA: DUF983 domain-containing protein [Longimicrobiales bacterium]
MNDAASTGWNLRRAIRLTARGLRRRCPNCGSGDLFRSWLRTRPHCRGCGLLLDRGESDFFIGAYTVNFVTAELLLVAFLALIAGVTWPDVPWSFIYYGGIALMVIAPIAFFPFSRTLWLAIDLAFRPATAAEFAPRAAVEPAGRPPPDGHGSAASAGDVVRRATTGA